MAEAAGVDAELIVPLLLEAGAGFWEDVDCEAGALACCLGTERGGTEPLGAGDKAGDSASSNEAGRSFVDRTVELVAFWSVAVLVASLFVVVALLLAETLLPASADCFAVLL